MSAPVPRDQAALRFSQICTNCRVPTELVEDHAAGDLICRECGLVLESHAVEESSEWRTFSESDKANRGDPNRVGGPVDPLLSGGGLGTGVARGKGDAASAALARTHSRQGDPERALLQAFGAIGAICSTMQLPQKVKDEACELYKLAVDNKFSRRMRNPVCLPAACVILACRKEKIVHNAREICGGVEGTTANEILRVVLKMKDEFQEVKIAVASKGGVFNEAACGRLASHLGLPSEFSRAAREIARSAFELQEQEIANFDADVNKQPLTMTAVSLYLAITLHGGVSTSLADVSNASSMASETIDAAARLLFPYARVLCSGCPPSFKQDEALRRIEARYPRVVDVSPHVRKLVKKCVDGLNPPGGLPDAKRPAIASCAVAIADTVLQEQWQRKHGASDDVASLMPRALAAAVVWLAVRLSPWPGLRSTPMQSFVAAGGVGLPSDMRAAARVMFPRVRALAPTIPEADFTADDAVSAVERDATRLLWMGDAAALASAIVQAALSGVGAPQHVPLVAPAACALAPVLQAQAEAEPSHLPEVPRDALSPAAGAAAALLAARLLAGDVVTITPDDVARVAFVDTMAVLAIARATFTQARALAQSVLAGCSVSDAAVLAVEAEYRPPGAAPYEDERADPGADDDVGFASDMP